MPGDSVDAVARLTPITRDSYRTATGSSKSPKSCARVVGATRPAPKAARGEHSPPVSLDQSRRLEDGLFANSFVVYEADGSSRGIHDQNGFCERLSHRHFHSESDLLNL